jgi:predicted nucleic acid-binding protein
VTSLFDTSVLIDVLRGRASAVDLLRQALHEGPIFASEITRIEILVGMQPKEERETRLLFTTLTWQPLTADIAEQAGALGRTWRPSHRNIDIADLIIAATAMSGGHEIYTRNVKHFPMFSKLVAPY